MRVIGSKSALSSAPAGYRFPREVIAVAVRWYLRYGLSYRDVEELLAERGIEVDHVTISRWVQTFTPEFIDAARPTRHAAGERWFVDARTLCQATDRLTYRRCSRANPQRCTCRTVRGMRPDPSGPGVRLVRI